MAAGINNGIPDEIKLLLGLTDVGEYLTDKVTDKFAEVFK